MASHSSFPPLLLTLITSTQQSASLCVPFIGKKSCDIGGVSTTLYLSTVSIDTLSLHWRGVHGSGLRFFDPPSIFIGCNMGD